MMTRTLAVLTAFFMSAQTFAASTLSITGAGATFPYPLYSKWFSEFHKKHPQTEINYQSIGSGGGIRQLLENTVDFGASDAPMKDDQLKKAKIPVLHFPTVLGAVVLTYNLPGVTQTIRFTPELIADLFLGKIYYWNDAKIQSLNPEIKLPDVPVMIVHRSDGSGTTAVFTDYLSKVSAEWKSRAGSGTAIKWPIGLGGKGNEGVTGFVKNSPGALGYVELLYAEKNHLPAAHVKNSAGEFIKPEAATITKAAEGALKTIPKDFRVSITNPPGKGAYPISSFTYLLFYQKMPKQKGNELRAFLEWAYADGQSLAATMFYAPLPKALITKVRAQLTELRFQ